MDEKRTILLTGKKARWLIVDASIPVALLLIIWWPIGDWLLKGNGFVFERVVGGGDLLAISFAFLVAYITEHSQNRSSKMRDDNAHNIFHGLTIFFALVAAVTYGVIKIYHTQYGFPADKTGSVDETITEMARFSLNFCIFTVAYIYVAKSWFEKVR
jgi:hypothetical protein